LTKELVSEKNPKKKAQLIADMKRISIISWEHLNFTGTFDFSDEMLEDAFGFNVSELLKVKIDEIAA